MSDVILSADLKFQTPTTAERQIREFEKKLSRSFRAGGSQPLGKITGQVSEFEKSLEAANARVVAFGASAGIIAGVSTAIRLMVSETLKVGKALTDINVLLGQSSGSLKRFGDSLFTIAKNTGASFYDVAEAAKEFSRQGLSVEDTLSRTNDAMILVRLSGLGLEQSVSSLTASMNGFAKEALTTTQIVNRLANVDAAFAVSTKDLSEALSRTSQVAQDAGVSFNELISLVAALQQRTARGGAVIGNSLKTIFTRIQRPDTLKQLEQIGISVKDAEGNIRPLMQVLSQLSQRYDTLNATQKTNISQLVGGTYQINIVKALFGDLGRAVPEYERALGIANNTTDEAIKRNEELNRTLSALANSASQNFTKLAAASGKLVFGPALENVFGTFNQLADQVDGEGIGEGIGSGILKGIGNALAGPGLIFGTLIAANLFKKLAGFSKDALSQLSGIGQASSNVRAVEAEIVKLLQGDLALTEAILHKKMSQAQVEAEILTKIRSQIGAQTELAAVSRVAASNLINQVGLKVGTQGLKGKNLASGHIPVSSLPPGAVSSEVAGARAEGYQIQPSNVRAMRAKINGQNTTVVYNNKEKVIHDFGGSGEPAIIPPTNALYKMFAKGYINAPGGTPKLIGKLQDGAVADNIRAAFEKSVKLLTNIGIPLDQIADTHLFGGKHGISKKVLTSGAYYPTQNKNKIFLSAIEKSTKESEAFRVSPLPFEDAFGKNAGNTIVHEYFHNAFEKNKKATLGFSKDNDLFIPNSNAQALDFLSRRTSLDPSSLKKLYGDSGIEEVLARQFPRLAGFPGGRLPKKIYRGVNSKYGDNNRGAGSLGIANKLVATIGQGNYSDNSGIAKVFGDTTLTKSTAKIKPSEVLALSSYADIVGLYKKHEQQLPVGLASLIKNSTGAEQLAHIQNAGASLSKVLKDKGYKMISAPLAGGDANHLSSKGLSGQMYIPLAGGYVNAAGGFGNAAAAITQDETQKAKLRALLLQIAQTQGLGVKGADSIARRLGGRITKYSTEDLQKIVLNSPEYKTYLKNFAKTTGAQGSGSFGAIGGDLPPRPSAAARASFAARQVVEPVDLQAILQRNEELNPSESLRQKSVQSVAGRDYLNTKVGVYAKKTISPYSSPLGSGSVFSEEVGQAFQDAEGSANRSTNLQGQSVQAARNRAYQEEKQAAYRKKAIIKEQKRRYAQRDADFEKVLQARREALISNEEIRGESGSIISKGLPTSPKLSGGAFSRAGQSVKNLFSYESQLNNAGNAQARSALESRISRKQQGLFAASFATPIVGGVASSFVDNPQGKRAIEGVTSSIGTGAALASTLGPIGVPVGIAVAAIGSLNAVLDNMVPSLEDFQNELAKGTEARQKEIQALSKVEQIGAALESSSVTKNQVSNLISARNKTLFDIDPETRNSLRKGGFKQKDIQAAISKKQEDDFKASQADSFGVIFKDAEARFQNTSALERFNSTNGIGGGLSGIGKRSVLGGTPAFEKLVNAISQSSSFGDLSKVEDVTKLEGIGDRFAKDFEVKNGEFLVRGQKASKEEFIAEAQNSELGQRLPLDKLLKAAQSTSGATIGTSEAANINSAINAAAQGGNKGLQERKQLLKDIAEEEKKIKKETEETTNLYRIALGLNDAIANKRYDLNRAVAKNDSAASLATFTSEGLAVQRGALEESGLLSGAAKAGLRIDSSASKFDNLGFNEKKLALEKSSSSLDFAEKIGSALLKASQFSSEGGKKLIDTKDIVGAFESIRQGDSPTVLTPILDKFRRGASGKGDDTSDDFRRASFEAASDLQELANSYNEFLTANSEQLRQFKEDKKAGIKNFLSESKAASDVSNLAQLRSLFNLPELLNGPGDTSGISARAASRNAQRTFAKTGISDIKSRLNPRNAAREIALRREGFAISDAKTEIGLLDSGSLLKVDQIGAILEKKGALQTEAQYSQGVFDKTGNLPSQQEREDFRKTRNQTIYGSDLGKSLSNSFSTIYQGSFAASQRDERSKIGAAGAAFLEQNPTLSGFGRDASERAKLEKAIQEGNSREILGITSKFKSNNKDQSASLQDFLSTVKTSDARLSALGSASAAFATEKIGGTSFAPLTGDKFQTGIDSVNTSLQALPDAFATKLAEKLPQASTPVNATANFPGLVINMNAQGSISSTPEEVQQSVIEALSRIRFLEEKVGIKNPPTTDSSSQRGRG